MVQRFRASGKSGPWSLTTTDPEEARLVHDVLTDVLDRTDGHVWLSKDTAGWSQVCA